jgi:hypothetical protein
MHSLREMQNNSEYDPDMVCTSGELGLCSRQGEEFPFSPQLSLALGPRTRRLIFLTEVCRVFSQSVLIKDGWYSGALALVSL